MADLKNVEGVHRLTPAQAGILYECLTNDDPALYFEQYRADLGADVDVARLREAWQLVVDRHEALRTMIVWQGLDDPVQVVRREAEIDFRFVEGEPGEIDADQLAAQSRAAGIPLDQAPLCRVTLVRTAGSDSVAGFHMIWDFHHIVIDGWSAAVVIDELLSAYDGDLPIDQGPRFSDHLGWLHDQDAEAAQGYWKELLAGVEGPTRFRFGYNLSSEPASQAYRHGRVAVSAGAAATNRIVQGGRDLQVTTNTVLQGACAIALGAYSSETDLVFGVTTSGRNSGSDGMESTVGMFLKTLPFRVDTGEPAPVSKWLRNIQDQQLSADEYANVSLAQTLSAGGVAHSEHPFDLVWIYENYPRSSTDHFLRPKVTGVYEQTNYPMTIMAGLVDSELEMVALHDQNLISAESARSFLGHIVKAAVALSDRPDDAVPDVAVLDQAEVKRSVAVSTGPVIDFDLTTSVPERFEIVARRFANKPALLGDDRSVTFAELDELANGVAAHLNSEGVRPGDSVAIEMGRSLESVAAMLGVLKTGAAYAAIDPSHPATRRATIKATAGVKAVLDQTAMADIAPATYGPQQEIDPTSTALITFTSGSTGEPKGVPVAHQGLINRLEWQWGLLGNDPQEVMAHKTNLTFVDHLWELWGGLLAGRTVRVLGDDVTSSLASLVAELRRASVTQISLVPSLLEALCEHTELGEELPDLKLWTVSGEPLTPEIARLFYGSAPQAQLWNLYGMSEASQDSTAYLVPNDADSPGAPRTVSIGRPIANMAAYIVGPNSQLVPEGVVGELCVAGIGVSSGYLGQPDLTAAQFQPNPFGPHTLYHTGDLAWRRRDGNLELVGRADRQVKIRGIRIEPGEIEAALRAGPGVRAAAVVAYEQRLHGFVVGEDVDLASESRRLGDLLPAIMVPSVLEELSELPLTPSGKLDRMALSLMAQNSNSLGAATQPDKGPVSDAPTLLMMKIWSELLGRAVGGDDDFFDSGGHSLLGLKLMSRIQRETGRKLSLSVLADARTPRAMALFLAEPEPTGEWAHLVALNSSAARRVFVVHGAGGNVLNFADLARQLDGDIEFVAIRAAGADGHGEMARSVDELCDAYVAEIVAYQPYGEILLAGFSNGGLAAYEMAHRLRSIGREVAAVLLLDTFHPSCVGRPYGWDRHWRDFKSAPVRFGARKIGDRLESLKVSAADRFRFAADRWSGEATERAFMQRMISIWAGYQPAPSDCPVVLFSAGDTHEIFRHVGPNRQWPDLVKVVVVPGNHKTHVEGPNAAPLAAAMREVLSQLAI